jgi:hypothetical protein
MSETVYCTHSTPVMRPVVADHMVKDNHHVAGKDMCVGFLCIGVWGGRKAVIYSPIMGMQSYVRVSVDRGTCKASGNNKEYPSQKNDVSHPVEYCEWSIPG